MADTQPLSQSEVTRAATASPTDSTFELGNRTFAVCDLDYPNYLTFLEKLEPMFTALTGTLAGKMGVSIPGATLNVEEPTTVFRNIIKFCGKDLPELAAIVCNMSGGDKVDAKWVVSHAKDPYTLVSIVMLQIAQNNMIAQFASFFVQVVPMLMGKSLTEATPESQPKTQAAA
jgi:hypothetical protein